MRLNCDSVEFAEFLNELLSFKKDIYLKATGDSMSPTISNGQVIRISPLAGAPKKHDVVFYEDDCRQAAIHRVVGIVNENNSDAYLTCGDNSFFDLALVSRKKIYGRVVAVCYGKKEVPIKILYGWKFRVLWGKVKFYLGKIKRRLGLILWAKQDKV